MSRSALMHFHADDKNHHNDDDDDDDDDDDKWDLFITPYHI